MLLKLKSKKLPVVLFSLFVGCSLIHTAGRIRSPSTYYVWASFTHYLRASDPRDVPKNSSYAAEYDYSEGPSDNKVVPKTKKHPIFVSSQRNRHHHHHGSRRIADWSATSKATGPTERPLKSSTTNWNAMHASMRKFKKFINLPKPIGNLSDLSMRNRATPKRATWSKEELKSFPPVSISMQVSGDDEDYAFSSVDEDVDSVDIQPTANNVTPPNTRLVIYNRVPKCGSTTFNSIIDRLCKMNFFRCEHSSVYDKHWLETASRRTLLHRVMYGHRIIRSKIFERHIYFFNVTRLKNQKFPPSWWFDMTLDECLDVGRPECHPASPQMNMQLTFFCGHHPECRKMGSRWALHRAKRHAEQYYSVVGILEEFTLSLSVLEGYLPRYFGNVHKTQLSSGKVKLNTNNSPSSRKRVSPATLDTLQKFLKEDIEFYEFLRQRLHLQANALGLLTS